MRQSCRKRITTDRHVGSTCAALLLLMAGMSSASAFVPNARQLNIPTSRNHYRTTKLGAIPPVSVDLLAADTTDVSYVSSSTSTLIASTEGWRQYVPLAVICLVLLDIVLGSPLANLALAPMKRAADKAEGGAGGEAGGGGTSNFGIGVGSGGDTLTNPKERVDTASVAQDALDRAQGTLELMQYLEENKSDEQRYEEMRKKLDRQMEDLDGK